MRLNRGVIVSVIAFSASLFVAFGKNLQNGGRPELPMPDAYSSENGVLHIKLKAVQSMSSIDGRLYDGMLIYQTSLVDGQGTFKKGTASTYVGPEWRVKPGDRLIVDYINALPEYEFNGVDGVNEELPQPINLHTHGLIVSPAGNGDNVLLSIPPGRSNRYVIDIPKTQHEGLYWYHPHIHGLTDDQVYGGLAGQIVVGRADGNYREFDGLEVKPMMIRYHVQEPGKKGELVDASSSDSHGTALVRDGGAMLYTVNGLVAPSTRLNAADTFRGTPAESQIWAFTNITGSASYILGLEEVDAKDARDPSVQGTPLEMVIVSVDGSPLPKPLVLSGEKAKAGYHLPQGGRVAVLVQGASDPSKSVRLMQLQNRSGSGSQSAYNWPKQQYVGGWRDYTRDVLLATYTDSSAQTKHVETPSSLTTNYAVSVQSLENAKVDYRRTFYFNDVAKPTKDTPNAFPANFGIFPDNRVDQPKAGTVEEWTILNYSSLTHPFHVHTQYGEVMEIVAPKNPDIDPDHVPDGSKTGEPYPTLQYVTDMSQVGPLSFTQDVIGVPPAEVGPDGNPVMLSDGVTPKNPGKVVLRVSFVDYLGTYVEHCHRLPHEDRGMMSLVRTIPNDPVLAVAIPGGSVNIVRSSDFSSVAQFAPFPGFTGKLTTAVGDVDGDAIPDVAVAVGAGRRAGVRVYSGASSYKTVIADFAPFDNIPTGASLALGDLNGDAKDEFIVGEGAGGKSRVVIYDGSSKAKLNAFQPYEAAFKGGVNVAAGTVEEGGRVSLLTAPSAGRAPEVRMYNVDLFGDANGVFKDTHKRLEPILVAKFMGADAAYQNGLYISTANVFAPHGGFSSILTSTLTGSAVVNAYAIAGSHDHGAHVTASGVHRATAYSPSGMRTANKMASLDLVRIHPAARAGVVVGAYSTETGANLILVPTGGGSATRWGLNAKGDGLAFVDKLNLSGLFVSGM
jgi:FtsP/CotA-like multicopper oxidase with cupredoxin domain